MTEREVVCPVCGKTFTAHATGAKYCSDECRGKAARQRRKDWEESSGYRERQREAMKLYRDKKEAEAALETIEAAKKAKRNRQQQIYRQEKKHVKQLQEDANGGNAYAKMLLAGMEHGVNTVEYWEAFRAYEIEYAKSWGKTSTRIVNGFSVNDEDFAIKVKISIDETGKIFSTVC